MASSTITSKGQATIPRQIRKLLKINPRDRISFHVRNGRVWIEGQRRESASLFGKYKRRDGKVATVEEMNQAIRNRVSK
jgi:antitoxin PrlF